MAVSRGGGREEVRFLAGEDEVHPESPACGAGGPSMRIP